MYLSLTKTKFQKRGGWDMKKSWLSGVLMLLAVLPVGAQQVMYSNLKELVENRGDTMIEGYLSHLHLHIHEIHELMNA